MSCACRGVIGIPSQQESDRHCFCATFRVDNFQSEFMTPPTHPGLENTDGATPFCSCNATLNRTPPENRDNGNDSKRQPYPKGESDGIETYLL